jgi:putative hemolysin
VNGFDLLVLVIAALLVVVAGVLAAAETAFTHLRRGQAEAMVEEERRNAPIVLRLVRRREQVLNPILLLVLTCHLAIATLVGALVERRAGGAWVPLAVAAQVVVIFVLAEALPKTWALQATEQVALRIAPLVRFIVRFPPVRWLTSLLIAVSNRLLPRTRRRSSPAISEEELLAMARAALQARAIDAGQHDLIESALELGDTVVREIMVPRPDMVTVEVTMSVAEAVEVVLREGKSRVPVVGEDADDVLGIAHARDLLRAERDGRGDRPIRSLLRAPYFVPETKRAGELLRDMQSRRYHLAVVVDEYGGTAGLVTLEDVVEELIGEIVDEFDVEEPLARPLASGELQVHGRMPVYELNELLGTGLPDDDWDTVGGLIFSTLGHVPSVGESVEADGVRFLVQQIEGRRIARVRVTRLATPEPHGADEDDEDDDLFGDRDDAEDLDRGGHGDRDRLAPSERR